MTRAKVQVHRPEGGQGPNRLGGTSPFDEMRRNGRPTPAGLEVQLVRWERDPRGDWCHRLVTGLFVRRADAAVHVLVDGVERRFDARDGWMACAP